MLRFDHIGLNVVDLDAAVAFFTALGFELEGRMVVEGPEVDAINGLHGVRAELAMVRTPDGSGRLEVVKYHAPVDPEPPQAAPSNRLGLRHLTFEVSGLDDHLARIHADGYELVGEVCEYGGVYRLCYVRGPEGLIVELAENTGHREQT